MENREKTTGSRLIQYYFKRIDRVTVIARNLGLIVYVIFSDLNTLINHAMVLLYSGLRTALSTVFGVLVSRDDERSLIMRLILLIFRIFIGIPILVLISIFLGLVVLAGGTVGGVLGLRNLGDYSATEQLLAWAFAIVLALTLPFWVSSYLLYKLCLAGIFSIIIVGLNFLYGQCGIVSLGHAAFVLVGGYTTTLLYNGAFGIQLPFIVTVFLGALISGLFGMLLGGPSLRVKDEYLLIVTLAFVIAVPQVLRSHYLTGFGGASGEGIEIKPILPPSFLSKLSPSTWGYYLIVSSFTVLILFSYNLRLKSQIGRVFGLIKCDDVIALAQGVNVTRYKLLAFVLSAFYAGFAGGLAMIVHPFVGSESYTMSESIDYFIGLIIGGPSGLFGNVLGGVFLSAEEDMIKAASNLVHGGQNIMRMFYGVILVIMINFFPDGIGGIFQRKVQRRVMPRIRRGLYFMRPPADYDFLAAKNFYDIEENKNEHP